MNKICEFLLTIIAGFVMVAGVLMILAVVAYFAMFLAALFGYYNDNAILVCMLPMAAIFYGIGRWAVAE